MEISGYIATLLGTAIGLVSLFFSVVGWKKQVVAAIGIILVAASAFYTAQTIDRLSQTESTFRQAEKLLTNRQMNHTDEGFILAALAFLEAKKLQFPDTYSRALDICARYACTSPDREPQDAYNSIEAASIFESIIEGIAVMHSP